VAVTRYFGLAIPTEKNAANAARYSVDLIPNKFPLILSLSRILELLQESLYNAI
jgi:hypothetical protein